MIARFDMDAFKASEPASIFEFGLERCSTEWRNSFRTPEIRRRR